MKSLRREIFRIEFTINFLMPALLLTLFSQTVHANTEEIVNSIFSGQAPYMVVSEDKVGPSVRSPGIYVLDGERQWKLVIPGRAFRDRTSSGVIQQLAIHNSTRRHEAVALVDDKLFLFHINSDPKTPGSILEIGSKDYPILDPISNRPVGPLPPIEYKGLAIKAYQPNATTQLLLISVPILSEEGKRKRIAQTDSGITFAVFFKGSKDRKFLTPVGAMALDFRYYPVASLDRFFVEPNSTKLFVPLQIDSLLRFPLANRDSARLEWEEQIKTTVKRIRTGSAEKNQKTANQVTPYFDFSHAGEKDTHGWLTDYVYQTVAHDENVTVHLNFDAAKLASFLSIGNGGKTSLDLVGSPDALSVPGKKKTEFAIWPTSELNGDWETGESTIVSINGGEILFVAANEKGEPATTKLVQGGGRVPTDVVMLSMKRPRESGQDAAHFSVVSLNYGGGKGDTYIFKTVSTRSGVSKIAEYNIANRFISKDELKGRLKVTGSSIAPNILFNAEARLNPSRSKKDTRPYIDLIQSIQKNSEVTTFASAKSEDDIGFGQLRYLEFDDAKTKQKWTGIYWGPMNRQPAEWPLLAQPLWAKSAKGSVAILDSAELEIVEVKQKAPVAVFGVDSHHREGKEGFELILIAGQKGTTLEAATSEIEIDDEVGADDSGQKAPTVNFLKFPFEVPFAQLKTVRIIEGVEDFKSTFSLIVTYVHEGVTKIWTGSFRMVIDPLTKTARIADDRAPAEVRSKRLSALEADDLSRRIFYNKDGRPHLVLTAELSEADPAFTLLDLYGGKEVAPNIGGRGMSQYRSYASYNESSKDSFGSVSVGSWFVFGMENYRNHIAELVPNFSIDKKMKASVLKQFRHVQPTIDPMFGRTRKPAHVIYVVSDHLKPKFYQIIGNLLDREGTPFSLRNYSFDSYYLNPAQITLGEVAANFHAITARSNAQPFLLADGKVLVQAGTPELGDGDEEIVIDVHKDGRDVKVAPHILYWIGTEGKLTSPEKLAKSQVPPKVPTILVVSPAELKELQEQLHESGQEAILSQFSIDTTYAASDWRIWHPESDGASREITSYFRRQISPAEENILPNLLPTARHLSEIKEKPKYKVLLADEKLMGFVRKTLLSRWASAQGEADKESWSAFNEELMFHEISQTKSTMVKTAAPAKKAGAADPNEDPAEDGTQSEVQVGLNQLNYISNLQASQDKEGRRSVVFAELSTLQKIGRPAAGPQEKEFTITDPADSSPEGTQLPHILYLLATGGKQETAKQFSSRTSLEDPYSLLLVGTPQQWDALKRDVNFEERFGLLKNFEVEKIESPSFDTKVTLLDRIFETPGIRGLNFKFELEANSVHELSPEARRRQVVEYLVNRAENVATTYGSEPTSAFLRTINEFQEMLVSDPAVRQSRVIDLKFVERVISKVFGLPLNFNILPATDPLRVLQDEERAALKMQQAGYEGPLRLKMNIISTVLAQTRNSTAIPIPSSALIYGDSSTGKTFLFVTLIKMLGLKSYDFRPGAANEEAMAIIINGGKIGGAKSDDSPESMTADEAIKHLNTFLSSPVGYRGFILFDDIHKAPPAERQKLLSFINSLFESTGGLAKIRDKAGMMKEVPVKNLTLMVTLNPTPDRDKIDRYAPNGTDEEMIVASLTCDENNPVEVSFLKRFGSLINLSEFPVSAKGPKLIESLRDGSTNIFNAQRQLLLMSPRTIAGIVSEFESANAREFLNEAVQRYLDLTNRMGLEAKGGFVLTIPTKAQGHKRPKITKKDWEDQSFQARGRIASAIQNYVTSNTVAVPLAKSMEGKIEFLEIMVDSFRTLLHEGFVNDLTNDMQLASNHDLGNRYLAPLLHAIADNIQLNPFIPMKAINIQPHEVGFTQSIQMKEFAEKIAARSDAEREFFPVKFSDEIANGDGFLHALNLSKDSHMTKRRIDVLTSYSNQIQKILDRALRILARVQSDRFDSESRDLQGWLGRLKVTDPKDEFRETVREIRDLYDGFKSEILAADTVGDKEAHVSQYDLARLYMVALDRGIARLPWGPATDFMSRAIDLVSNRTEMGQKPGVQYYLFKSKLSLLRTATHELVPTIASANRPFQKWIESGAVEEGRKNFPNRCELLFATPVNAAPAN